MRILHLTDHYLPVLGGIESHVAALAARQAARGDEVVVLTSTRPSADGWMSNDAGPVRVRRARSAFDVTRRGLASYDVVHAHLSVVGPFSAPVAALAARAGVPTVVTVHSLWSGLGPLPKAAAALAGLRTANVVWTAVSRVAADQLAARLPAGSQVPVLPNAVDVPPRAVTPLGGRGRPVRLASTMRIARRKRPLQLLDMFDLLRRSTDTPVELTVVGDGPLRPQVERRLRRRGLCAAVRVTGRLGSADVVRILAGADVYVAPASLESFGLAALEARCVGLPVVGQAASGVSEFVSDGVQGWLTDSDEEMVDRLRRVVEDHRLRHRVAEHNRTTRSPLTWRNALLLGDAAYALAQEAADPPRRARFGTGGRV